LVRLHRRYPSRRTNFLWVPMLWYLSLPLTSCLEESFSESPQGDLPQNWSSDWYRNSWRISGTAFVGNSLMSHRSSWALRWQKNWGSSLTSREVLLSTRRELGQQICLLLWFFRWFLLRRFWRPNSLGLNSFRSLLSQLSRFRGASKKVGGLIQTFLH